ncbi:MAG: amidohydrolase family protein [Deltaproteobacteria bacterium]|nr:amidohydrolase family protein [Deltaproteobacteria bacterium]
MKSTLILLFFAIVLSCSPNRDVQKEQDIVFKNVNVISMIDEQVLENKSVYISNGKIVSIGEFEDLTLSQNTLVINADDKFLLPGFSDMHVHTYYEEEPALFLVNGVTTIRNMWGLPEHLEYKEANSKKEILGPTLYTTGPLIDGSNPIWPNSFILDNPADVEQAIKKMKKDGYDFIKVYDGLNSDVYNEIIRVAKKIDIPVVGHVPDIVGIEDAINSGQSSIEHFDGYSKFLSAVKSSKEVDLTVKSMIWNCPTLKVLHNFGNLDALQSSKISELKYVSGDVKESWKGVSSFSMDFDYIQELLKTLNDKGAKIVSGTDVGNPYVIAGFSLHDEFQLMQESGLTPFQVLLTTTVNPAEMLGIEDHAGTIEAGKDADLVLLNKNPLIDIENTKTIEGVMTKGIWLTKKKIQEMLDEIESEYKVNK